jgi:serine/threonine protein kinase
LAVFTPKDEHINQKCGTPGYVAPEILRSGGNGYSYKCDIFSLGSVFFNLLTGRYLFGGNSRNEVLRHNEKCDLSSKKKYVINVSENGQSLLFQMLNSDPNQRPTARDVLNHPWFSDERVLLNNLIYLNDFLSNAKGGSVN